MWPGLGKRKTIEENTRKAPYILSPWAANWGEAGSPLPGGDGRSMERFVGKKLRRRNGFLTRSGESVGGSSSSMGRVVGGSRERVEEGFLKNEGGLSSSFGKVAQPKDSLLPFAWAFLSQKLFGLRSIDSRSLEAGSDFVHDPRGASPRNPTPLFHTSSPAFLTLNQTMHRKVSQTSARPARIPCTVPKHCNSLFFCCYSFGETDTSLTTPSHED